MRPQSDSRRRAVETLRSLGLPEALQRYNPVLAGTVPLGVDIPGSDLDIICHADDVQAFADHLRAGRPSACEAVPRWTQARKKTDPPPGEWVR